MAALKGTILAIVASAGVTPALAQTAAGGASASAPAVDRSVRLEEVIVTAQKRSERLQDVPLSITALQTQDIERAGIRSTMDLTASVTGLRMTNTSGNTAPAIRGITQLTGGTPGTDPSVATYVDGVYQSGEFALKLDLPDVSRIEVDKGPQGTLFGRNATGGAIQVFTKDPSFTPGGQVGASYGNYDDFMVKGFITAPIIPDKLAASISAFAQSSDSYFHSIAPGVNTNGVRSHLERVKLLFTPTEDIRFVLEGHYGEHRDAYPEYEAAYKGITLARLIPGSIIATKPREIAANFPVFNDLENYGGSLRANIKTGVGDITLLGSYAHNHAPSLTNSTNAYLAPPYTGIYYYANYPQTTKTAELDFASKKFYNLSFVAGVYYFKDRATFDPLLVTQSLPSFSFVDSIFARQESEASAVFGEATYDLTDSISVIAGLRYSTEKRSVFGGALFSFDPSKSTMNIPGPWYEYGHKTDDGVSERLSIRYKPSDSLNIYFTYSTGFRSGTFDVTAVPTSFTGTLIPPSQCTPAAGCAFPRYVEPEKVKAYEVGAKSQLASWLKVNGAIFRYDYTNQQISAYQNIGGIPLAVIQNAASSRVTGAEINADLAVSNELLLQAGASILHGRFRRFPNAIGNVPAPDLSGTIATPVDASGRHLPFAPDLTLSASAVYTRELEPGKVSVSGDVYYTDEIFFDVANIYKQPSYTTVGARASFSPNRLPGLTVSAWGKNLTNKTVIQGAFITSNSVGLSYDAPRTYGVSMTYDF